jgi:SRSO17 transposase
MLADARWSAVNWRRSTNGRLAAQFTATRVRAADGPPQRIGDKSAQHMPGEEVWLVGEHCPSGEQKYYLFPISPPTRT